MIFCGRSSASAQGNRMLMPVQWLKSCLCTLVWRKTKHDLRFLDHITCSPRLPALCNLWLDLVQCTFKQHTCAREGWRWILRRGCQHPETFQDRQIPAIQFYLSLYRMQTHQPICYISTKNKPDERLRFDPMVGRGLAICRILYSHASCHGDSYLHHKTKPRVHKSQPMAHLA